MNENNNNKYEVIARYIKDVSFEIPTPEAFVDAAKNLGTYITKIDFKSNPYKGNLVEAGDVETVIKNPKHPYTQLLIDSIPEADPGKKWGKLDMEKTQNKILTSPSVGWRK